MKDLGLKLFTVGYTIGFLVGGWGLGEVYRQFDLYVIKESVTTADIKSLMTNQLFIYAIQMIASLIALIGLFVVLRDRGQTEKT